MGLLDGIFGNTPSQTAQGMPDNYNQQLWASRLAALGTGFTNASRTGGGFGSALTSAANQWQQIPGQLQKQQLQQMQLQDAQQEMQFRQALQNARTPEERMRILQTNPRMAMRIAQMDYQAKLQGERDQQRHKDSLTRIYANAGAGTARSDAERKRKMDEIDKNTDLTPEQKRKLKFEISTGIKYGGQATDYTGSVKTYLQLGKAFDPSLKDADAIKRGYELSKSTAGKTKKQWINDYVLRNGASDRTLTKAREMADKLYGTEAKAPPASKNYNQLLDQARNAIKSGKDPDAVKKRLKELGVPESEIGKL